MDIHERLARWLDIMSDYAFEICHDEGKQNVLADYLSGSVGEVAVEGDKKEKQTIQEYFCKCTKEDLEIMELIAMVCGDLELEESLRIIKNVLVSGGGTKKAVRLRRQAN